MKKRVTMYHDALKSRAIRKRFFFFSSSSSFYLFLSSNCIELILNVNLTAFYAHWFAIMIIAHSIEEILSARSNILLKNFIEMWHVFSLMIHDFEHV